MRFAHAICVASVIGSGALGAAFLTVPHKEDLGFTTFQAAELSKADVIYIHFLNLLSLIGIDQIENIISEDILRLIILSTIIFTTSTLSSLSVIALILSIKEKTRNKKEKYEREHQT